MGAKTAVTLVSGRRRRPWWPVRHFLLGLVPRHRTDRLGRGDYGGRSLPRCLKPVALLYRFIEGLGGNGPDELFDAFLISYAHQYNLLKLCFLALHVSDLTDVYRFSNGFYTNVKITEGLPSSVYN